MAVVSVSLPKQAILPELSFVPYRIPSAIILALPKTSINASRSITKANRSIRPSMAQGNLQFIWQCHPKRKPSILNAILSQAQDGHFYNAIFFEHRSGSSRPFPLRLHPLGSSRVVAYRRRPGEEKMT